ncbi:hypothetical protein NDU88_005737 [Pleurodeles waltl]|uniref:Uncharacterized protein n=1 Tax=Pleurodeles waltl TaxID=8319 RepID=A0AAV7VJU7_PLEWA|nr:hypothetical protein NDU88_005737 [Pleurodeles waltl]
MRPASVKLPSAPGGRETRRGGLPEWRRSFAVGPDEAETPGTAKAILEVKQRLYADLPLQLKIPAHGKAHVLSNQRSSETGWRCGTRSGPGVWKLGTAWGTV